jgi:hypothetical protein
MEDEIEGELDDLQIVEIQELLEEHGIELSEAEIADLAQFVKEAGGLEAALEALRQLSLTKKAA